MDNVLNEYSVFDFGKRERKMIQDFDIRQLQQNNALDKLGMVIDEGITDEKIAKERFPHNGYQENKW